jgi:hypothetical protein
MLSHNKSKDMMDKLSQKNVVYFCMVINLWQIVQIEICPV